MTTNILSFSYPSTFPFSFLVLNLLSCKSWILKFGLAHLPLRNENLSGLNGQNCRKETSFAMGEKELQGRNGLE